MLVDNTEILSSLNKTMLQLFFFFLSSMHVDRKRDTLDLCKKKIFN